ncbi:MAG: cytochrome ubiquinol oxidase subunit I [Deltaproteobacteria bacterium]|nr:cytochrome ubiquinol oxidase subunit I [Deltaproteobacteria bacterium]
MDGFPDTVTLSRVQFALTAMFHIIWPVVTIGLSLFLVFLEIRWIRTADERYYRHARFWGRLFLLNVAIGVATGFPMEFQFGTNWSFFSRAGGDFFGHMLGYEAAMAFMLEASFIGIMIFGWKRVSPLMHLFATSMVALGASLSAFWIMVANSWMQTPRGGFFDHGKFVVTSHLEAIFNPDMVWSVTHMWVAAIEITVFVVGGLSAWYLYKQRHTEFFLASFKWAVLAAIVVTPLQIFLGDGSGRAVYFHDPAKLAAFEAHWQTNPPGKGAAFHVVAWPDPDKQENLWSIEIPYVLSLLTDHTLTGEIKGLRDFPRENQPPVALPFYAFRIMVAAGTALFVLMLWTLYVWRKGGLAARQIASNKWLLRAWMAAVPASYLAMETGWVTREVGRQPWVISGLLRTSESASNIPASAVATSLAAFALIYIFLTIVFFFFARRIIRQGPESSPDETRDGYGS